MDPVIVTWYDGYGWTWIGPGGEDCYAVYRAAARSLILEDFGPSTIIWHEADGTPAREDRP
jgi:hypothetical protein